MNWFLKVRLIWLGIRISKNPLNYADVQRFRILLGKAGLLGASVRYVEKFPENRKILTDRPLLDPNLVDLARLRALPEETLGFQFVRFLDQNHLELQFYSEIEASSREGYLHLRVLQTHDLWHVVVGCGTDIPGELQLQAFMMAQLCWPTAPFYIGGYLIAQAFRDPLQIPAVMDRIFDGWRIGKSARPLLPVDWAAQWDRPLLELQKSLAVN